MAAIYFNFLTANWIGQILIIAAGVFVGFMLWAGRRAVAAICIAALLLGGGVAIASGGLSSPRGAEAELAWCAAHHDLQSRGTCSQDYVSRGEIEWCETHAPGVGPC